MPDELRAERLLKIYKALCESKDGVFKNWLVNKFEVSSRTIERDIQCIEQVFSLLIERKKGADNEWRYFLAEPYRNRNNLFVNNDKTIMLLFELAIVHFKSFAENDLSKRLLESITCSYPLRFSFDFFYYHDEAPHRSQLQIENLLKLREAFINKKIVSLKIENRENKTLFSLYKIIHYVDEYFLIGKSCNKIQILSLHNIKDIKVTQRRYFIPKNFSCEKFLEKAFAIEPGNPEKVVLRIKKPLGDYIKARIWHPTQRIEEKDSFIILEMKVPVAEELIKWILGYGDNIEVLEPERLKKIIKREAEKICTLYKE